MKHPSVKVDIGKTIRDTTNKDVSNSLKWGDLLYRKASYKEAFSYKETTRT